MNYEKDYSSAIKSLQDALLHFSASSEISDDLREFRIRWNLAIANEHQGSYQDALHELLFIIKKCLVQESENKADTYFAIARISQKIHNSSLFMRNLQLAYNVYLKVLGKDHPKTQQCYIALFEEHCNQQS